MLSAHSRSAGSCDRCVSAMVLYELAELALHIRRLPSNNDDITNAGPKTALLDMDRSHFSALCLGRTEEEC